MKRHVLLRRLVEFDSRLDERIFGSAEDAEVRGQRSEVRKEPVEFGVVKSVGAHLKRNAGLYATGAGVAALGGVTAAGVHNVRKQNRWRKSAGVRDYLQVGGDLVVDRHGAMYPMDHPRVKRGNVKALENAKEPVELTILPYVGGAAIGGNIGTLTSRKRKLPDGTWVDEEGNPTGAPVVRGALGTAAGVGAVAGHQAVMRNYGGAGGVGEAYRNVGRNIGRSASSVVPYAQDAWGIAKSEGGRTASLMKLGVQSDVSKILAKLKKLRGAATARFGRNAPRELVEFEARLDDIIFRRGDVLLRKLDQWKAMQPKSVQRLVGQAMGGETAPFVHATLRRDLPAFAKATELPHAQAGILMQKLRGQQAMAIRQDRKKGVLKTRYRSMDDFIKRRLGMSDKREPIQFDMPMAKDSDRASGRRKFIAGVAWGTAGGAGAASIARLPNRARLMATSAKHGMRVGYTAGKLAEKLRRAVA